MSTVSRWYERQFEFTFPPDVYPNLCARLRGTPARLEELVRGRALAMLTRKPEEKWSAQEHIGHLLDLEPLWVKRVEDFVRGGPELSATDLSNRKTHEANYNAQSLEKILADFRAARALLVERTEELDPALFFPRPASSPLEKADAAGGPPVLRCRTRRSPSGADLGVNPLVLHARIAGRGTSVICWAPPVGRRLVLYDSGTEKLKLR